MHTLKVGYRDLKVNPTYKILRYAIEKYDTANMAEWPMTKYDEYILDILWKIIVSGKIFKPFITKNRMISRITVAEMTRLRIDVNRLINGGTPLTEEEWSELQDEKKEVNQKKR